MTSFFAHLLWLSLQGAALASPHGDPVVELAIARARSQGLYFFLGDGEWNARSLEQKLRGFTELKSPFKMETEGWGAEDDWLQSWTSLESACREEPGALVESPCLTLRPSSRMALGDAVLVNNDGDVEAGLLSLRVLPELRAYAGGFELDFIPSLGGDALGLTPDARLSLAEAWVGFRGENLLMGFGRRSRWLGPSRRGALILSNNAAPAPMGNVGYQWYFPGIARALGLFRFETSMGWADRSRGDVDHPGLLLMDARWMPTPMLEIGATRLEMFGGKGRPMPSIGQLLLPTRPHVYGDDEKELADQNDIASLDFRLNMPANAIFGGPVRYVEAWWQYGAEDIIAREWAGLPYPSLAGVANVYGAEACVGDLLGTIEFSRVFDDYYRWYLKHRIYSEGFTQEGRIMGHPIGGDAESWWFRLAWSPFPWTVDVWHERVLRIGVIEDLGYHLFALSVDEQHSAFGASFHRFTSEYGVWGIGFSLDHIEGLDFIPGSQTSELALRVDWRGKALTRP